MASIVIPAHNEACVIGRLIGQIQRSTHSNEFEIIVVANGCTDNTAEIAAGYGESIRVVTIPVASKHEALAVGNRMATSFPRLYIDADVELYGEDIRAIVAALSQPGVMCAGPQRTYNMAGRPWIVRWFYDIWTRLPEVRRGLFGRGVVGVSADGYARIEKLPALMADDLAASLAFRPEEKAIVSGANVLIHPPRTLKDLLHCRVRAVMGADEVGTTATGLSATARTRIGDIVGIVCRAPHRAPQAALFLGVAMAARRRASRLVAEEGYTKWLRDQSSREIPAQTGVASAADQLADR